MRTDWNPVLKRELEEPYWAELQAFVQAERATQQVFPPNDLVFQALHRTAYASVRVLILGQDPYHGPGQAHGLAFSVPPGFDIPPSLRNIHRELVSDLGISPPNHGDLRSWADQGVLLLNTVMTVRAHQANSHQGKGWERFSDAVIRAVDARADRIVFLLWGASARKKRLLVTGAHHTVIESAHPSPLSAHNGFFGSRPFSRANAALVEAGREPIDWRL